MQPFLMWLTLQLKKKQIQEVRSANPIESENLNGTTLKLFASNEEALYADWQGSKNNR